MLPAQLNTKRIFLVWEAGVRQASLQGRGASSRFGQHSRPDHIISVNSFMDIQFTNLKGTIQWFLIYPQSCLCVILKTIKS